MPIEIEDKNSQPIDVGDVVTTQFRGGKREGVVKAVIANQKQLDKAGDLGVNVTNPPKVVFDDQHGHTVSHNPQTLEHVK